MTLRRTIPADVRPIISSALVISVAVGVFAVSFGVVSVASGASVLQTCALSLFVFTGASQFSAVSVIAAGGSVASALGGALLLAARNGVYGLSLAPTLRGSLGKQLLAAHFVIDETTALASAHEDMRLRRWAFWACGISLYTFWNIGTLIGALIGNSIDPKTFGLDAAFPVVFTAMIVPHLRTRNGRRAASFGAVAAVALAPFLPVGLPILIATFGILFGVSPDQSEAEPT